MLFCFNSEYSVPLSVILWNGILLKCLGAFKSLVEAFSKLLLIFLL
jgi:hypothetical protein